MKYEYALQAVKGIKKVFDNAQGNKIKQYMPNGIIDIYDTTEVFEIFTSTEGMTGSKKLANGETPPVLDMKDGYSVLIEEERFGGGITLLENEYRREMGDKSTKVNNILMQKRNKLLTDNTHLFLTGAFSMLNDGFSSSSSYLAPDGVELFGVHNWKAGGTFDNSSVLVFGEIAVDAVVQYGGEFTDPNGKPMPVDFDTIIVKKGSPNAKLAKKLFAENITPTKVADINIYEGTFKIIETPYITDRDNWFMRASMFGGGNSLKIGMGDYPTLREPIKLDNEAIRTNCTGFWKQGIVNMPMDQFGSTGKG